MEAQTRDCAGLAHSGGMGAAAGSSRRSDSMFVASRKRGACLGALLLLLPLCATRHTPKALPVVTRVQQEPVRPWTSPLTLRGGLGTSDRWLESVLDAALGTCMDIPFDDDFIKVPCSVDWQAHHAQGSGATSSEAEAAPQHAADPQWGRRAAGQRPHEARRLVDNCMEEVIVLAASDGQDLDSSGGKSTQDPELDRFNDKLPIAASPHSELESKLEALQDEMHLQHELLKMCTSSLDETRGEQAQLLRACDKLRKQVASLEEARQEAAEREHKWEQQVERLQQQLDLAEKLRGWDQAEHSSRAIGRNQAEQSGDFAGRKAVHRISRAKMGWGENLSVGDAEQEIRAIRRSNSELQALLRAIRAKPRSDLSDAKQLPHKPSRMTLPGSEVSYSESNPDSRNSSRNNTPGQQSSSPVAVSHAQGVGAEGQLQLDDVGGAVLGGGKSLGATFSPVLELD